MRLLHFAVFLALTSPALALDAEAVRAAKTTTELAKLGAVQLSEAEFKKAVVGKKLDEGSWTWVIKKDGTSTSKADDGSWTDTSPWQMKGDAYCRAIEGKERCSEVWQVGDLLRFTEKGKKLAGWTVEIR